MLNVKKVSETHPLFKQSHTKKTHVFETTLLSFAKVNQNVYNFACTL